MDAPQHFFFFFLHLRVWCHYPSFFKASRSFKDSLWRGEFQSLPAISPAIKLEFGVDEDFKKHTWQKQFLWMTQAFIGKLHFNLQITDQQLKQTNSRFQSANLLNLDVFANISNAHLVSCFGSESIVKWILINLFLRVKMVILFYFWRSARHQHYDS